MQPDSHVFFKLPYAYKYDEMGGSILGWEGRTTTKQTIPRSCFLFVFVQHAPTAHLLTFAIRLLIGKIE